MLATGFPSREAFLWLGEQHEVAAADDEAIHGALRAAALADVIYAGAYCTGGVLRRPPTEPTGGSMGRTPFVESLSAANAGRGTRQAGWTLVGREGADVVIDRGGLRAWATEEEVTPVGCAPGASLELLVAKEQTQALPGFYVALGDRDIALGRPLDRLYWNVAAGGAARLVAELTASLNGAGIAFRLKVPDDPDGYDRCDAGVLYCLTADRAPVLSAARTAREHVADALAEGVPAFTLGLAAGLALAEDPGGGRSFGLDRCRAVAMGLLRAADEGLSATEDRVARVLSCLADAGVDLDHPHLRPPRSAPP